MSTEQDTQYKLTEEVAKEQLQIFLDYYDIEDELNAMSSDNEDEATVKRAIDRSKQRLIKGIRKGHLEITSVDGLTVTQIMNDSKVTYQVMSGRAKIEMDKQKGNHKQLYALLGFLCESGYPVIERMKQPHLGIAEALGALFMIS